MSRAGPAARMQVAFASLYRGQSSNETCVATKNISPYFENSMLY
jgi:hypothetical protein